MNFSKKDDGKSICLTCNNKIDDGRDRFCSDCTRELSRSVGEAYIRYRTSGITLSAAIIGLNTGSLVFLYKILSENYQLWINQIFSYDILNYFIAIFYTSPIVLSVLSQYFHFEGTKFHARYLYHFARGETNEFSDNFIKSRDYFDLQDSLVRWSVILIGVNFLTVILIAYINLIWSTHTIL